MTLLSVVFAVLLAVALVVTAFTISKYKKLSDEYNKTLEWGKAMQSEAIKQGDLYRNASNQLDILNSRRKK